MSEPLLTQTNRRFVLFPIQDKDIWRAYKDAESNFWVAEELDFAADQYDWENRLNNNERHFVKNVLGFFAASDGIVGENLAQNFYTEVALPEARSFYGFQLMMEGIHSETYSLLIDTYVKEPEEKDKLFNAIDTIPAIGQKAQWALKWMDKTKNSFAERLVAFAVVEGLFFSGSFCSIYWLKKRGLMPGLAAANDLISRDEAMHADFAVLLYKKLTNKLSNETIYQIVDEALQIEDQYCTNSLPVGLIGMNAAQMSHYLRFVADGLLTALGLPKKYNTENPFEFMATIALKPKTNFFEKRVTEYQKANVGNEAGASAFNLTEDF